jgi:nitrile hydratase accessory protein
VAAAGNTASPPDLGGIAAYPRKNGEPVFDEPWQSRAFGMVASLYEEGVFEWDEFKERLIAHIAAHEEEDRGSGLEAGRYYEHWMAAFYDLAVDKGLLAQAEITEREHDFRTGVRRDVY